MHIAFFDNGNLSYMFGELAKRLIEQGHPVSILCLSQKKANVLHAQFGVRTIVIDTKSQVAEKVGAELVRDIEQDFPLFSLNKSIMVDRVLKDWEFAEAERFLCTFAGSLHKIVTEEKIERIFGEITWGVEFLAHYLMRYLGKDFYSTLNTSVIPGRFNMLNARNDSSFLTKEPDEADFEVAAEYLHKRINTDINKAAAFLQTSLPPNMKTRLKALVQNYDGMDYRYSFTLKKRLLKKYVTRSRILRKKDKLFQSFAQIQNQYPNRKYVLMALHVQPEATPDLVAPEVSNQYELAANIARNLPADYLLLLKEHPNGIGSRSIAELQAFRQLPNTMLLDPFESTLGVMKNMDAVFTIAGTIAFEASVFGIPTFVFSDVYYDIFPKVQKVTDFTQIGVLLRESNRELTEEVQRGNLYAYAKVYRNSCKGTIYDPMLMPKALDESNLNDVTASLLQVLQTVRGE